MKRIIHFMVLSCRKATELIDKKSVVPLSVTESIQLKVHKKICEACRVYESQGKKIDGILGAHLGEKQPGDTAPTLNPALKNKIIHSLPED